MKIINIRQKLDEIGVKIDSLSLGMFDEIGEYTAKRWRDRNDLNYHKFGCFYRSNLERGILLYSLIRMFDVKNILEVGFGRGYSTFCAVKAFLDAGIDGKVHSIDPNFDENFLNALTQIFDKRFFSHIFLHPGTSKSVYPSLNDQKFDLIIIDGDHTEEAVKLDWNFAKDRFTKFVVFDDYHMNRHDDGIQVAKVVDEINEAEFDCKEKELIKMDRRIFNDDRGLQDDEIDYGQVLLTKNSVVSSFGDW